MSTPEIPVTDGTRLRRAWGGTWRLLVVVVSGVLGFTITYGMATEGVDPAGPGSDALAVRMGLDALLGLGALILYPFRHRAPLVITTVIVLCAAASTLGAGAACLAIVSLSTRRRWQEISVIATLSVATGMAVEYLLPLEGPQEPWWLLLLLGVGFTAVLVLTGMYIGGRRQLRHAMQAEIEGNLRTHQAQLEQARATERTRIAREMHDVLAHRLSLVALHAGALEYRTDLPREQISETAGIVRANAHLAVNELREVLGVLRDPQATAEHSHATAPPPTLAQLQQLLAESRGAGTPVVLDAGLPDPDLLETVEETASRALYRAIQEGLTNARKHGPGQTVHLRLAGTPDGELTVSLRNAIPARGHSPEPGTPPALPASGMGLTGLTERLRLVGGTLATGTDAAGQFVLEAQVPWNR